MRSWIQRQNPSSSLSWTTLIPNNILKLNLIPTDKSSSYPSSKKILFPANKDDYKQPQEFIMQRSTDHVNLVPADGSTTRSKAQESWQGSFILTVWLSIQSLNNECVSRRGNGKGDFHKVPPLGKLNTKRKLASLRQQLSNWLSNTQWSVLKLYTHRQHWTDSAGCVYN